MAPLQLTILLLMRLNSATCQRRKNHEGGGGYESMNIVREALLQHLISSDVTAARTQDCLLSRRLMYVSVLRGESTDFSCRAV